MKKRMISLLACIAMCLSLCAAFAVAVEEPGIEPYADSCTCGGRIVDVEQIEHEETVDWVQCKRYHQYNDPIIKVTYIIVQRCSRCNDYYGTDGIPHYYTYTECTH